LRSALASTEAARAQERGAEAREAALRAELQEARTELERARVKADASSRQLSSERDTLKEEHARTRAEYLRLLEDARRRLEEERGQHDGALKGANESLLEQTRQTGLLEGQMEALSLEATALREEVAALHQRVRQAEGEKGKHLQDKVQLQSDLEGAKDRAEQAEAKAAARAEELERQAAARAAEATASREPQPKCGCAVQ